MEISVTFTVDSIKAVKQPMHEHSAAVGLTGMITDRLGWPMQCSMFLPEVPARQVHLGDEVVVTLDVPPDWLDAGA